MEVGGVSCTVHPLPLFLYSHSEFDNMKEDARGVEQKRSVMGLYISSVLKVHELDTIPFHFKDAQHTFFAKQEWRCMCTTAHQSHVHEQLEQIFCKTRFKKVGNMLQ